MLHNCCASTVSRSLPVIAIQILFLLTCVPSLSMLSSAQTSCQSALSDPSPGWGSAALSSSESRDTDGPYANTQHAVLTSALRLRACLGCECLGNWTFAGETWHGCANPGDDWPSYWCYIDPTTCLPGAWACAIEQGLWCAAL